MKIRWRLAWYGVGLTAAVLLLFNMLLAGLLVASSGDEQDRLLSSTVDASVTALAAVDVSLADPGDPLFVPDARTSDQPFTTVYDEVGTPIYGTATVDEDILDLPAAVVVEAMRDGASEITSDGIRSHVRRWTDAAGNTGVVAASQAVRVAEAQVEGARGFLFVFAFIALVATLIGAWFMSGRALRPVKLLAKTTDEIGRTGDLTRRLDPVDRDDEIGALTGSFNSMLDSIEAATKERDATIAGQRQFIADASHELRSPLTSILANAGFLVERTDADPEDREDATEDIRTEAVRMSTLVDRLLILARADLAAASSREHGPVDMISIASSIQRRARNLAVEIALDADGTAVVRGDGESLAEMLWILVDNADRHGGDRVTVSITTDAGTVRIIVADDGDGLDPDEFDRVFERFHRGDPSRTGDGHGLGLSIAQTIVQNHNGSISATNSQDGGAVFTVELPIG